VTWLLNTDVICQPAMKKGDPKVIAWLEAEQDRCYTSAIVIAQLAYWVRTKEGRQRQTLQAWLTRLVDALHGRIHGFNVSVAHAWAEQERLLDKAGQRMPVEDSYIAATARRYGLTIVTGNDRDFKRPGLKVFNSFKGLSRRLTPLHAPASCGNRPVRRAIFRNKIANFRWSTRASEHVALFLPFHRSAHRCWERAASALHHPGASLLRRKHSRCPDGQSTWQPRLLTSRDAFVSACRTRRTISTSRAGQRR
jgi:toxin FitB